MATTNLMLSLISLLLGAYLVSKIDRHNEKISATYYRFFGTKTAYDQVRSKEDFGVYQPPTGCTIKQFYLLGRHGTSFPSSEEIIDMHKHLAEIQQVILKRPGMIDELRNWTFSLVPDKAMALTLVGQKEIEKLGARLKQRFNSLLGNRRARKFDFLYTSDGKTKQSTKELLHGILGKQMQNVWLDNKENDAMLTTFKRCNDDPPNSKFEVEQFIASPAFTTMLANITERLNLTDCISVDATLVVYDICRYETAWNPQSGSPWCNVFQSQDLKALEYLDDLKTYYDYGYGNRNYRDQCVCTPLKDIITNFLSVASRKPYAPAVIRFTTSDVMLRIFTQLGFFYDDHDLTSERFSTSDDRQWRTSLFDPFASNIVFVLMKCNAKYRVLTLLQEEEVKLPACTQSPCTFDEFLSNFGLIAVNCNQTLTCY